jgi:uncharacterized protein YbjT (DUF2867 family)
MNLWIAGATGLVGKQVLALASADTRVQAITALVRRTGVLPASTTLREVKVDFAALEPGVLPECDAALCALGTTIKIAGSQAAFRAVDFDAVVNFARAAKARGARQFAVVSSMGASARSRVFYSRVKGEMEEAIGALGLESVTIVRPSFLSGERPENRPGENIALAGLRLLSVAVPKKYRAISDLAVARALLQALHQAKPGVTVLESGELHAFA